MMMHIPIAKMGLVLIASSLMSMILARSLALDRPGSRILTITGMTIAVIAALPFFLASVSLLWVILSLKSLPGGQWGFFLAPNNRNDVYGRTPADKQGVASEEHKVALNAGSSLVALYVLVMAQVVLFDVAKLNIMLDG